MPDEAEQLKDRCSCGGTLRLISRWRVSYGIACCQDCEGCWYVREEGGRWLRA